MEYDLESVTKEILGPVLESELLEYFILVLKENPEGDIHELYETVGPILLEASKNDEETAKSLWNRILAALGRSNYASPHSSHLTSLERTIQINKEPETQETEQKIPMSNSSTSRSKKKDAKRKQTKEKESKQLDSHSNFLSTRDDGKVVDTIEVRNVRFQNDMMHHNSRDIYLRGFTLSNGSTELLENTDLKLLEGRRYGLAGRNGVGKTTLLRQIASGKIAQFPTHLKTMLVEQEASGDPTIKVLECVLSSNREQEELLNRLRVLEMDTNENHSLEISEIYTSLDIDGAKAKAISILSGLQVPIQHFYELILNKFTAKMREQKISELSGGWRMRVSLACALFAGPDLLLLDEPTNHLDLPAVLWLQNYLQGLDVTLVIVSHDRAFLNSVVTDIISFTKKKLKYHPGNFDSFQKRKQEKLKEQQRLHEKDEKKQKQIKESIEKYKQQVRAHDPNQKMGMVRSRKKTLQKMGGPQIIQGTAKTLFDTGWVWGGEVMVQIEEQMDPSVKFIFPEPEYLGAHGPILQLKDVSFGYEPHKVLFEGLSMNIEIGSRIAILGPNGIGKSSLMQVINGNVQPLKGEVYRHRNLQLGYFAQHFVDNLDLTMTPLEHMTKLFPDQKEEKLRGQLSSFGLSGKLATQKITTLSGGQKSRVIFATITWKKPQILLLDEPTNHLDMNSIDALVESLRSFQGGVVLISHDRHLISSLESEMWTVGKGRLVKYEDTFESYLEDLENKQF